MKRPYVFGCDSGDGVCNHTSMRTVGEDPNKLRVCNDCGYSIKMPCTHSRKGYEIGSTTHTPYCSDCNKTFGPIAHSWKLDIPQHAFVAKK